MAPVYMSMVAITTFTMEQNAIPSVPSAHFKRATTAPVESWAWPPHCSKAALFCIALRSSSRATSTFSFTSVTVAPSRSRATMTCFR